MSGCGCRYLSVRVGEYHSREGNPARSTIASRNKPRSVQNPRDIRSAKQKW